MPFDSQGNFTRLHNWEQDRIDDIDIVTDHADEEDNNFADGLSLTFLRDGRVPMSGNLNMGNFQIKNLSDGALDGDAVNRKQMTTATEDLKTEITKTINGSLMIGDIKCSALQKDHGNWMICNGREVSREDYADLFEAIGETFGDGKSAEQGGFREDTGYRAYRMPPGTLHCQGHVPFRLLCRNFVRGCGGHHSRQPFTGR